MSTQDSDLFSQAVTGDQDALSTLIQRHGPAVGRRFEGRIPKRWQAVLSIDDLMQDTYTDAFLHIREFEPRGEKAFENWLTKIAKRKLINTLEMLEADKRGGSRRRQEPHGDDSYLALLEMLNGTTATPSRQAAGAEAREMLLEAVGTLQEDHRRVIQLYDLEGHSVQEVAEALNRSPGAVFMLRARAHRLLCQQMGRPSRF